jgi:hypothetical protein
MATLTTQTIIRTGLAPTYAAATGGGDATDCGTGMFLHIKNAGGSPITVTLAIPAGAAGYQNIAYTSTAVSVPATTGDRMIGPLLGPIYQDPTTGKCTVTYSGVTSVTVAAVNLSQG